MVVVVGGKSVVVVVSFVVRENTGEESSVVVVVCDLYESGEVVGAAGLSQSCTDSLGSKGRRCSLSVASLLHPSVGRFRKFSVVYGPS